MTDRFETLHPNVVALLRVLDAAGHLPALSEEAIDLGLDALFDDRPPPPCGAARILVAGAMHEQAVNLPINGARGVVIVESSYKNDGGWFSAFNRAVGDAPFRVWSSGWSRGEHRCGGYALRGRLVAEHVGDRDDADTAEEFSTDERNYLYTAPASDEERIADEAALAVHLARNEIIRAGEDNSMNDKGFAWFQFEDHLPAELASIFNEELAACGSSRRVYKLGHYDETICVFVVTQPEIVEALRALGQTIGDLEVEIDWATNWWPGAEWSAFALE